jgi:hypothetical protein
VVKLFKTKGLGQWDNLYVRPDSKRLPIAFKYYGANYCGSRPDRIPATTISEKKSDSTKVDVYDVDKANESRTADCTFEVYWGDLAWWVYYRVCDQSFRNVYTEMS